jgi:CheY-like chemotaxis protein
MSNKAPHILVIDDSETDAKLMMEAIKHTMVDSTALHIPNTSDAIKVLNQQDEYKDAQIPDLIFMDLNMPEINGVEFLKIVKKDARFIHIPVIVLTATGSDKDIMQCYQHHANCYIVKPVNFTKFQRVISVINDYWLGIVRLPPKD